MKIQANTPEQYIETLPEDRKDAFSKLRKVILDNLPKGFSETVSYRMIGYVVPHSIYPKGYCADPKQPLPLIHIASQKNHIALYHIGIYSDKALLDWFLDEYPKFSKTKPDMGKGCIRFKKAELIPFELIGKLAARMTVKEWIEKYEDLVVRRKSE
jgi:hypothetical protein